MKDGNGKFKAQQFMKDLGLHFDVQMLDAPKDDTNLIPFISSVSMRMDNPTHALSVHIRNLLASYSEAEITAMLKAEVELLTIDMEMLGGFYEQS